MNEPKPLASLSSTLLARKGQAKPAMRPQGFGGFGVQTHGLDDLGWNDMGHDRSVALTPLPSAEPQVVPFARKPVLAPEVSEPEDHATPAELPVVHQQIEELERSFDTATWGPELEPEPEPEPEVASQPEPAPEAVEEPDLAYVPEPVTELDSFLPRAAAGSKGRAAFTLRLDPERHLKLRLAAAVSHKSAQTIVAAALDRFLQDHEAAIARSVGKLN